MAYTPKSRTGAVRLFHVGSRGIKATAYQIGIAPDTLRRWLHQTEVDEDLTDGLSSDEQAELKRLHRQVKILQGEKGILPKAALVLARETGHHA